MKKTLVSLMLVLAVVKPVQAEIVLFESAALGTTGLAQGAVAATNVTSDVFTGVRFELTQPVVTSQIGGHFVGSGTFFGTLITLDDEDDFPDSGDLESDDVLGHAELTFPTLSDEVFGELSLSLNPGWYALVFGSGLFDTFGDGAAPNNNSDLGASYIGYQSGFGWGTRLPGRQFVLKGAIIPEPSTIVLSFIACAALHLTRRN